jgi:diguanylate cyclase (GGDEF)-like protein
MKSRGPSPRDERRLGALESRLAARSAAALLVAGSVPLVVGATRGATDLAGLAAGAFALGLALAALDRLRRVPLAVTWVAELAGLGIVAGAVALTGESHSPYMPCLLFPLVHAAVFQPHWRAAGAWAAGVGAQLAPLVYDASAGGHFAQVSAVVVPVAVVLGAAIHLAVDALRRDRRRLGQREAEAREMAEVDELTGVGNYRRFRRALAAECARSRRHEQPFSLIVLDLDGFKAINDELGHQAGDEALRRVAEGLQVELRTEDVLCRQGGDEFAVIAVGAGEHEAQELADRLTAAVGAAAERHLQHPLSASAGQATYGQPATSPEEMAERADQGLRQTKVDVRPPPATGPRHLRARRLASLGALSRALALAKDEWSVVEIGVLHVADALHAATVQIWRRRDPGGPPLLVARGHPAGGERDGGGDGKLQDAPSPDPGHLEEVLRTNRLLTPNSARAGQMLVPISHAGRAAGVLFTASAEREPVLPEHRRLALAMAAQIGRALATVDALRVAGPRAARRLAALPARGAASEHVTDLARSIGERLGMAASDLDTLERAAELHDLGLIGIPAGLLLRPSRLSPDEERILHEHPLIAERLLRSLPRLREAARVLRHVHERYDGTGYPDALAGPHIPLAARVLHAAIAFEAMVSPRPYRAALSVELAREELRRVAGTQLDPDVVAALDGILESEPPAWTPGQSAAGAAG